MCKIFRAAIGDVVYALDLITMEIITGSIEGVVRTDKHRNYFKVVASFPRTQSRESHQVEMLVDEHTLHTTANKSFYCLDLRFAQDKKKVLKEDLEKKLLNEIGDRIKILKRIGSSHELIKAKVDATFALSWDLFFKGETKLGKQEETK